jgi:murein DD-endopeptidase MepM/ murein hydrolase activator NlpD
MNIRIGLFGFLFVAASSVLFSPGLFAQERVHTVQRGETLYSIARTLGLKADDLMKYNGITDPSRLLAGQTLKIPPAGTTGSPATGSTNYRVVKGDTLYSIAREFSVTVASIQELNGLSANYLLKEGDFLKIPANAVVPAKTQEPAQSAPQQGTANARGTEQVTVNSKIRWPIAARELSYMTGKLSGVVITGTRAESVSSLTRGTVLSAGPYRGFGKVVIIQVDGGYLYVYGGLENLSVKEGDRVGQGSEIGKLGLDAVSNKPQLFFMVYLNNAPVDPAKAPRV